METVERDYSAQGVKFFYIYKALAHPETNGYVTPFTLEERLQHVAEAKRKLGTRISWLCDSMSNDLKHALGNAPNSEFIIDPEGTIVRARRWSRPEQLREDLTDLVGEVDDPITADEIGMKPLEPPETAPTGVVARLELPGRMSPVKVEPVAELTDEPFYAKLRAEVDRLYFRDGTGKLYLGFFLDPLYEVHWNNRVAPIRYKVEAPGGVEVAPASGKGPDVDVDADADPREFLLSVSAKVDEPIKVTVKYFACDDAETFCKPVTQHYEVSLQRDPDGGWRRVGGFDRRRAGRSSRRGLAAGRRFGSRPARSSGDSRSQSRTSDAAGDR